MVDGLKIDSPQTDTQAEISVRHLIGSHIRIYAVFSFIGAVLMGRGWVIAASGEAKLGTVLGWTIPNPIWPDSLYVALVIGFIFLSAYLGISSFYMREHKRALKVILLAAPVLSLIELTAFTLECIEGFGDLSKSSDIPHDLTATIF